MQVKVWWGGKEEGIVCNPYEVVEVDKKNPWNSGTRGICNGLEGIIAGGMTNFLSVSCLILILILILSDYIFIVFN